MFGQVHYPVRITGFGRLAMRRDVQRLLADCDVHAEDIRCNWQWASGCYRAATGLSVLLACWIRKKPPLRALSDGCRLEYDPGTLNPKAFWTDLPTPELQKQAITWNGSNMVSPLPRVALCSGPGSRPSRHSRVLDFASTTCTWAVVATDTACSVQAGRPITVQPVSGLMMQRAILNPLSMGSRGRYVLVLGVQVRHRAESLAHACGAGMRASGTTARAIKDGCSDSLPFGTGPQENANLEDIVRFFDGYELMGNPVTVLKTVSCAVVLCCAVLRNAAEKTCHQAHCLIAHCSCTGGSSIMYC
jgi:hypothetical protein